MVDEKWSVTLRIYRQKGSMPAHYDEFQLEVDPDEYVLDAIERIWAYQDRSLIFRHACHHSTCGACGMRVNGAEKLTCITPIRQVGRDGGTIRVEPLRNFPLVSDLAVDMSVFYQRMEMGGQLPVNVDQREAIQPEARPAGPGGDELRLADCIECGLCISACPISASSPGYLGPAVLAGAHQHGLPGSQRLLDLVDSEDGIWRCHSAFECSAVCPASVEPGWRIMELRRAVIGARARQLFHRLGALKNTQEMDR